MKKNWPKTFGTLTVTLLAAFAMMVAYAGCGGVDSAGTPGTSGDEIAVTVDNTQVPANGFTEVEITARGMEGSSTLVGFYIDRGWGSWLGAVDSNGNPFPTGAPTAGAATAPAARTAADFAFYQIIDGKATATLKMGILEGRKQIIVRYMNTETGIALDFVKETPSLAIEALGPRVTTLQGTNEVTVRGNGRDTMEIIASVTGNSPDRVGVSSEFGFDTLTTAVGFFVPADWGAWQGGILGTDNFTYYPVDEYGQARSVLVTSTFAGSQVVIARYGSEEARLLVTFDIGVLTIFPSTVVIDDAPRAPDGSPKGVYVSARGGLPPIEWWFSHPASASFNCLNPPDCTEIWLFRNHDARKPIPGPALPSGGGTLEAQDREGQIATAKVFIIDRGCSAGTITVSPATFSSGTLVTIRVEDLDMLNTAGTDTITVLVSGPALVSPTTVPLAQPGGLGTSIWTATVPITCNAVDPNSLLPNGCFGSYLFTYPDTANPGENCLPLAIDTTGTGNG